MDSVPSTVTVVKDDVIDGCCIVEVKEPFTITREVQGKVIEVSSHVHIIDEDGFYQIHNFSIETIVYDEGTDVTQVVIEVDRGLFKVVSDVHVDFVLDIKVFREISNGRR